MEVENINVDRMLLDEKSYQNILFHDISYKTFIGEKSLRIRFNKVNGLIYDYLIHTINYITGIILEYIMQLLIRLNIL